MALETIIFENNSLKIINQQRLPNYFEYLTLETLDDVISSIKRLEVRGAPAIGVVAAYGFFKHAYQLAESNRLNRAELVRAAEPLKNCRPTAVNLGWAVDKMFSVFNDNCQAEPDTIISNLRKAAIQIHEDDKKTCDLIGDFGSQMINDGDRVLTHCNAGILATGGSGTALSVIYKAAQKQKAVSVYVDETRPVGQGARLTYWELQKNNIPATLITDNMAASLMGAGKIDSVIVGADRITRNGDVANKIGTYSLAVLANFHQIPFYVAAPISTFDTSLESGEDIPIEFRDKAEVLSFWNIGDGDQYDVYNPAFDVTPNKLISAIFTDKGIIRQPLQNNIERLFINIC